MGTKTKDLKIGKFHMNNGQMVMVVQLLANDVEVKHLNDRFQVNGARRTQSQNPSTLVECRAEIGCGKSEHEQTILQKLYI